MDENDWKDKFFPQQKKYIQMKLKMFKINEKAFLLLLSTLFIGSCQNQETNLDTEIAVPVSVMEVKQKSIEQFINTSGTVYATQDVLLKSQMSGDYKLLINPKTGRPFALGNLVEKGQEIIRLEDKEYENNIKIKSQELNLDISKREFEKQESLYEKGGVTLRELINAEREFINAQYTYDNAIIQLAKMEIKAPFNGVIVDLPYYTEGTKVDANQSMVKIMNFSKLYMEIKLPEKNIGVVKVNQTIRILNYTLPDDTFAGIITQLSPAIEPETRTFKGAVLINNPGLLLRPGMFIKGELIIARKDSAIVIPKDIILSKQRGHTVFVALRGAAQERIITTGLENPDEIEVIKGLSLNERLVIKGFETLRNRSKVTVVR